MSERRAIIVGGGIAALASAVALRARGWDVSAHERAPRVRGGGGALMLWWNGVRALDALGLRDALRARAVTLRRAELRSADGTLLNKMSFRAPEHDGDATHLVVRRDDLLDLLHDALPPGTLSVGDVCESTRESDDHAEALLADGRVLTGALVVGADGLHSAVRASLWGNADPRPVGQTAWIGTCPEGLLDIEPGVTVGALGVGLRFWYTRMRAGGVYWYAITRGSLPSSTGSSRRRALLELFRRWHRPVPALIEGTADEALSVVELRDRPAIERWSTARRTLVGDAAHPMSPDLGQGACQGLEDAACLGRSLAEASDVTSGLRAYEASRILHSSHVAELSWLVARLGMPDDPVACSLRDIMLCAVPSAKLHEHLDAVMNVGRRDMHSSDG